MDHFYQHTNVWTPYAFQQLPHFSACIHFLPFFSHAFLITSSKLLLSRPPVASGYFSYLTYLTSIFLVRLPEAFLLLAFLQPHFSSVCYAYFLSSLIFWGERAPGTSSHDFLSTPSTQTPWLSATNVNAIHLLMASKYILLIHTSFEFPISKFLHILSCLMSNRHKEFEVSKAKLLLYFLTTQTLSHSISALPFPQAKGFADIFNFPCSHLMSHPSGISISSSFRKWPESPSLLPPPGPPSSLMWIILIASWLVSLLPILQPYSLFSMQQPEWYYLDLCGSYHFTFLLKTFQWLQISLRKPKYMQWIHCFLPL